MPGRKRPASRKNHYTARPGGKQSAPGSWLAAGESGRGLSQKGWYMKQCLKDVDIGVLPPFEKFHQNRGINQNHCLPFRQAM
jgi:hypothetical protein